MNGKLTTRVRKGMAGGLLLAFSLLTPMACGDSGPQRSEGLQPVDILIAGGTVITMDADRRVLEDAAIAIVGDRIEAVGPTADLEARFAPKQVIDASRNVVMPGLIDGHGHAGHGLVKSLGTDTGEWYGATELIYAQGSTEDFWLKHSMNSEQIKWFRSGSALNRMREATLK